MLLYSIASHECRTDITKLNNLRGETVEDQQLLSLLGKAQEAQALEFRHSPAKIYTLPYSSLIISS